MAFTEAEATGRSADEEMNRTVELVTFQAPATKESKNTEKADKERLVPGETAPRMPKRRNRKEVATDLRHTTRGCNRRDLRGGDEGTQNQLRVDVGRDQPASGNTKL